MKLTWQDSVMACSKKLLGENKYARCIPCAGHSLNFVGCAAVDCCLDAVNFFGIVLQIYKFFSASTNHWAVPKLFLGPDSTIPKCLNDRWEAHAKTTSVIADIYGSVIDQLNRLHIDTEKGDTRRETDILHEKIEEIQFVFMFEIWNYLLNQFHKTSKALQDAQMALRTCSKLYTSLLHFLKEPRESFDETDHKAKENLLDVDYKYVNKWK